MSLDRRRFLKSSSLAAGGLVAAEMAVAGRRAEAGRAEEPEAYRSDWDRRNDAVWLGPTLWANPLQDWRIAAGRIECVNPARNRNVHLLTRELSGRNQAFALSVTLGRVDGVLGKGKGSAGFRIGIEGPLKEYRNNIVFGSGLDAGLTSDGRLFIGTPTAKSTTKIETPAAVTLELAAAQAGEMTELTLVAKDAKSGAELGTVASSVPAARLAGNVALVANFGQPFRRGARKSPFTDVGTGKFWFADWNVSGARFDADTDRAYGPILFNQYTLHGGVLTMTAQMPPLGAEDGKSVTLEIDDGSDHWKEIARAEIDPDARTATFRVKDWDGKKDVPYRLVYLQSYNGKEPAREQFSYAGTIRKDSVDQDVLTVADISCNIHAAFPNHQYTAHALAANPDLVAFVGDQFYESTGGYGVTRSPIDRAILDVLHKWSMHGWTWRELTKDRPSVALPDDHDVYQGNIWGEAGAGKQKTQEAGGYGMPVRWVNVVHRTQTSHHPAPHDPTPLERGISVYYGPLTYGGVSFAILADRMFKTGPEGVVPPTKGRGDHVVDPNFDPKTADVKGAELLGDRQMAFLRAWVKDWTDAEMKAVVSQTIFTAMATHHGGGHQRLIADYDANGWPQTPRDEALRIIRTCHAVHLAGDQHLPAVVHYGIDGHRDAGVAFAGPAVNVGYPRWWEPEQEGGGKKRAGLEFTGDYRDSFGNPITVLAYKNGALAPQGDVLQKLEQKSSGLGLVRFDKSKRTITFECWPLRSDPAKDEQMPGWPVTVDVFDNGPKAKTHLPLEIEGVEKPVVRLETEAGELVYSLRSRNGTLRLPLPASEPHASYRIVVEDLASGRVASRSVDAAAAEQAVVVVTADDFRTA